MDLNQARMFVEVVRAGSFAEAARRLDIPKSTVSARIQALETRLGARLLRRSTRQLALTLEGEAYYDAVAGAIDRLVDAEAVTAESGGTLSGRIRFTAPLEFPHEAIISAFTTFTRNHPGVTFEILLSNEPFDLVARNIDLALRGGDPGGAGHIIRKVGELAFGLYASPAYLETHERPTALDELAGHDLLIFRSPSESRTIRAADPLSAFAPRVASDNFAFLHRLVLAGLGIASLPHALVHKDVEAGRLIRLLEGWSGKPGILHLVFPSRHDISPRVRAFADDLLAALASHNSSI